MNDAEAYKLLEEKLSPDAFALVKGLLSEMEAQLSDAIIDVARKTAAKEREACLAIVDAVVRQYEAEVAASNDDGDRGAMEAANSIASLIRGRGET